MMPALHTLSLLPLSAEHHTVALQALYYATPGYWELYHWPGAPPGQAERDLQTGAETPGRYLLGIVRRVQASDPAAGAELIGLIDLRLDWPAEQTVYLGMFMVAEVWQRQGVGGKAWRLVEPWLVGTAKMKKARLGVEQFNHKAHQFFTALGFQLTGESNRVKVGEKLVRLLYMEKTW